MTLLRSEKKGFDYMKAIWIRSGRKNKAGEELKRIVVNNDTDREAFTGININMDKKNWDVGIGIKLEVLQGTRGIDGGSEI